MTPDNANKQLTDLLISKNFEPHSLDAKGQPAASPDDATMFSFDYQGESGKDYGTVVMMIDEEHNLNVYFGDNLGKGMEGDDKKQWFDFLYQVRQFAKRNMMTFSLQNLNKLKYSMQGQAALKEGLFEGWAGRKDISWNAAATEARLVIKHKKNLGEGEARFRYIESLFIETQDGERYRMPFKSLTAGKAMLEHVRQGGKPYDIRGNHISTIVEELNLLSRFRRANQGRIFEGETQQLVEEATHYFETLKHNLKTITTRTGYKKYFESWNPAALTDEDVIIEDLRHLFVEQNIDSRVEQALPLLAKLKQEHAMKEINVFESMMTLITEGTWALPDTPEKQSQLIKLLSAELPVGPDATNATELLYDLLGDDDLFDQLGDLAREDANADARTIVINKLEQMKSNPAVAQVIGKLKVETTPQAEPEEPVQEMGGTGFKREFKNGQWVKPEGINEEELCETCHQDVCECGTYESEEMNLDEQIDRIFELSRDTLKSYIKKAGSSGEENSASNLSSRAAAKWNHPEGDDDGEVDDHKSYLRSKGIGRAVDRLEEISDETVQNYKEKAWDDFARGNDRRGAGIGRALDKQRGAPGHVKTTGQDDSEDQMDEGSSKAEYYQKLISRMPNKEVAAMLKTYSTKNLKDLSPINTKIVNMLNKEMQDREADATWDIQHGDDQVSDTGWQKSQNKDPRGTVTHLSDIERRKAEKNREAGNRLTQEEYQQLAELSPDTLKNYIKKAGMSAVNKGAEIGQKQAAADEVDRYTNRHFPKGTDQYGQRDSMRKAVGADYDDINQIRSKAQKRVAGIGRAADRLEESGMSEVDLLLQEIARGAVDIMDVYLNPTTNIEKFVQSQLEEKAQEVAREQGYNLDDDIEDILARIQRELEVEYGTDDNMDIEMDERRDYPHPNTTRDNERVQPKYFGESDGDRTPLAGQYGHSGQLKAVEGVDADMMDRIKFLAGLTK
jgi:hypothetical protein